MSLLFGDRFRGGLKIHALGDSLGAPFEFRYSYPLTSYTGKCELPILWRARYGPIQKSVVGQTTDDNSMAIALMTVLLRDHDWKEEEVIKAYLKWANSGIKFLGKNTRALFHGVNSPPFYYRRVQKQKEKGEDSSESNGSLMRSFPLILLFEFLPEAEAWEKIHKDTSLSNPTLVNQEALRVYMLIFRCILKNISPNQGIPFILSQITTPNLKLAIEQASSGQTRNVKEVGKGWVIHPIYFSIQAWIQMSIGNSVSSILNWVVLSGGDTDTNAAIAGAVCGFYAGEIALRQDPIVEANLQIILSADTTQGDFPMDTAYSPRTGLQLLSSL